MEFSQLKIEFKRYNEINSNRSTFEKIKSFNILNERITPDLLPKELYHRKKNNPCYF